MTQIVPLLRFLVGLSMPNLFFSSHLSMDEAFAYISGGFSDLIALFLAYLFNLIFQISDDDTDSSDDSPIARPVGSPIRSDDRPDDSPIASPRVVRCIGLVASSVASPVDRLVKECEILIYFLATEQAEHTLDLFIQLSYAVSRRITKYRFHLFDEGISHSRNLDPSLAKNLLMHLRNFPQVYEHKLGNTSEILYMFSELCQFTPVDDLKEMLYDLFQFVNLRYAVATDDEKEFFEHIIAGMLHSPNGDSSDLLSINFQTQGWAKDFFDMCVSDKRITCHSAYNYHW